VSAASSQGAILLLNVVLARLLPNDDFAGFTVVLTLCTIVPAFFSLGMERLGVVIIANSGTGTRRVIDSILKTAFIASAAAGLVAFATTSFNLLVSNSVATLPLVAAVVAAENWRIMVGDLPRAWDRPDVAAVTGPALPRILTVLTIVVLAQFGHGMALDGVLAVLATCTLGSALMGTRFARRLGVAGSSAGRSADESEVSLAGQGWTVARIVRAGSPMSVANSALAVLNQADIVVMAIFFEPATVAAYAVASRTANLVGNVKTMFNVALLPTLSKRSADPVESERQVRLTRRATSLLFLAVTPPTIVLLAFGPAVLHLLYGEYSAGAPYMAFLAGGQIVSVASGYAGSFLLRDGRQRVIMWCQVGAAAVGVSAMLISGIAGSPLGVAASSGGATALCALLMAVVLKRVWGISSFVLGPGDLTAWFARVGTKV